MQSKAELKRNFHEVQTAIKNRPARLLEILNQRRSHCVDIEAEDDNSENSGTQFLQKHKTSSH